MEEESGGRQFRGARNSSGKSTLREFILIVVDRNPGRIEEEGEEGERDEEGQISKEEIEKLVYSLKEENEGLQGRMEMAGADLEEMQREIENANNILEDKDRTIKLLKKNFKLISKDSQKYSASAYNVRVEKELRSLMEENEGLRDQMIKNQAEFEDKERQMISEFNNLIMDDGEQSDGQMEGEEDEESN